MLTFDDWTSDHYTILVPALLERNMVATFFPVDWNFKPWSNLEETIKNGNEIGGHGFNSLTSLSASELSDQLRKFKNQVETNTSQKIISYAYPNGNYNDVVIDSVINVGYLSSRTVEPYTTIDYTYNFATKAKDYYKLKTSSFSSANIANNINHIKNSGGLLILFEHIVTSPEAEKQLDIINSEKNSIWLTTLEKAIKYHQEARCSKINEILAFDGNKRIIELTDTLSNNDLYNQPLSIKLKTNGIYYNHITQNNVDIPIDSVYNDSIMFKAIPDAGYITLTGIATSKPLYSRNNNLNIQIIPVQNILNFEYNFSTSYIQIKIFDITGREIRNINFFCPPNKFSLNVSDLNKGLYLFKLQADDNSCITKKIVLN
ncbi:MAG: polysaccharide deacetylase family protein [Marinilabiliaceae bacterium]|nr:polysaccharide deacetylase family protein [Marinilabiliaceae bacterium]